MKNIYIFLIYLIVTLVFIIGVILSFYDYCFSGYYTNKIINWIWLAFTGFIIIWFFKKKAAKIYFISLFAIVGLSILPMAIPFYCLVDYFSTLDDYDQVPIDNTYRLETTKPNPLARDAIIVYEKKYGILEKQIMYDECYDCLDIQAEYAYYPRGRNWIQSAKVLKRTSDSISMEFLVRNKKSNRTYSLLK